MSAPTAPTPFDQLLDQGRQAYASGRPDAAVAALDEAFALATTSDQLRTIAMIHRRFGRLEQTAAALRAVLRYEPDASEVYLHIALLQKRAAEDDEVRAMLALYAQAPPERRFPLGFALGKTYEDLGQFDRSFAFYAEANAIRRATVTYSRDATAAEFAAIEAAFSPALFDRFAGSGIAGAKPIFIVGMPRSGSTLTEQILASHPAVLGGGEMNLLDRLEATMLQQSGKPSVTSFIADAAPVQMADWANAYLAPVRQALGRKTRFTDKNLDNFRRIGLIRLLFPDARIIHCTRDPLDNCFSIYRRLFAGATVPYGYDLEELGHYYGLYRALMAHWDAVLPGFVLEHSYEALVAEPEAAMRRLLSFCDLDWHPAVLDFHKTERGVATASAVQVRQPVYTDSVGFAEAFRPHLGKLIGALGPIARTD